MQCPVSTVDALDLETLKCAMLPNITSREFLGTILKEDDAKDGEFVEKWIESRICKGVC